MKKDAKGDPVKRSSRDDPPRSSEKVKSTPEKKNTPKKAGMTSNNVSKSAEPQKELIDWDAPSSATDDEFTSFQSATTMQISPRGNANTGFTAFVGANSSQKNDSTKYSFTNLHSRSSLFLRCGRHHTRLFFFFFFFYHSQAFQGSHSVALLGFSNYCSHHGTSLEYQQQHCK